MGGFFSLGPRGASAQLGKEIPIPDSQSQSLPRFKGCAVELWRAREKFYMTSNPKIFTLTFQQGGEEQ